MVKSKFPKGEGVGGVTVCEKFLKNPVFVVVAGFPNLILTHTVYPKSISRSASWEWKVFGNKLASRPQVCTKKVKVEVNKSDNKLTSDW